MTLLWTKSRTFRPNNADVIKNMLKIQKLCQKLAAKRYPIKS